MKGGKNDTFTLTASGTGGSAFVWEQSTGSGWSTISGSSLTQTITLSDTGSADVITHYYRISYNIGTESQVSNTIEFKAYKEPTGLETKTPTSNKTEGGLSTNSVQLEVDDSSVSGIIKEKVWQYSDDGGLTWNDISGATTNPWTGTLTFATGGNKLLRLKVSNPAGSSYSNSVGFRAYVPAIITDTTVNPNIGPLTSVVSMSANVQDGTQFQWQQSEDNIVYNDIGGAVTKDSTNTIAFHSDGRKYIRLGAKNDYNDWTYGAPAFYEAKLPPTILEVTVNPAKSSVPTTIELNATVLEADTYQWSVLKPNESVYEDIVGATTVPYSYNITSDLKADYFFKLTCTNIYGTTVSNAVKFTLGNDSPIEDVSKNVRSSFSILILLPFLMVGFAILLIVIWRSGNTKLFVMALISGMIILIIIYLVASFLGLFENMGFGLK